MSTEKGATTGQQRHDDHPDKPLSILLGSNNVDFLESLVDPFENAALAPFNGSQRLLYNPLELTRLAQLEMVSSRSGILMGTGQSDLPRPSTGKEAQAAVSGNGGLALLNPQMFQTAPGTPMSPYLTESAHVFSLQNPLKRRESRLNEIKVTESAPPIEDSLEETLSRKSSSETLIRKSSPTLAETSAYSPKKLYLKTLKTFESRFRAKHDVDQDPAHNTAAGAKGCCQIPIDKLAQLNSKSASWFKDEHGTSKFSKKIFFGKAPWHRKESGDSCSSVASSVREILRGSTPPGTPVSGYTAHSRTPSTTNFQAEKPKEYRLRHWTKTRLTGNLEDSLPAQFPLQMEDLRQTRCILDTMHFHVVTFTAVA
uniref:Uncharacterized protein n=1 Tax=Bionectria ochroleuca TaxID=29856 RepID=A0A8H7NN38_BIOOC